MSPTNLDLATPLPPLTETQTVFNDRLNAVEILDDTKKKLNDAALAVLSKKLSSFVTDLLKPSGTDPKVVGQSALNKSKELKLDSDQTTEQITALEDLKAKIQQLQAEFEATQPADALNVLRHQLAEIQLNEEAKNDLEERIARLEARLPSCD